MSPKEKPILYVREKLAEMIEEAGSLKWPVLQAGLLLLLAAVLTYSVVGISQNREMVKQAVPAPAGNGDQIVAKQPEPEKPVREAAALPAETKPASAEAVKEPDMSDITVAAAKRPLTGTVTMQFGWQLYPVLNEWRFHNGIDIRAADSAAVTAVWPGKVSEVYQDKTVGLTVAVVSGDYRLYYGSLAAANVREGDLVQAGAPIGIAGQSPGEANIHLHLVIKKNEKYIDPAEIVGNR